MCLVYFLMIPRTYTLKEQQLVSIFFFGNPAVCEIDPQEVNLTLSVPDGSSNPRNSRVTEKNLLINGSINVCN